METQLLTKKLEIIENELNNLKIMVLIKPEKYRPKIGGMLKGLKVTEEDLNSAEKSLFHSS